MCWKVKVVVELDHRLLMLMKAPMGLMKNQQCREQPQWQKQQMYSCELLAFCCMECIDPIDRKLLDCLVMKNWAVQEVRQLTKNRRKTKMMMELQH